jgi:Uma2 family endonuclease
MAINEAWTVQTAARKAEPAPPLDLSKPIPTWNTPEYPAEWPKNDMSAAAEHAYILHYLLAALSFLLKRRGRPWAVTLDVGLHFVDADGRKRRCDPDMMVMPFPNTERGSLRRQDMPCPPDCVIEVASPSTRNRDLGIKKDWYAWMGVREYWILDPVNSDDPAHFETGLLLPNGPMMGWRLEQGRYEPLATFWDAGARAWSAYSPSLDCGLLFSEALHRQHLDGGYRVVDPETDEPLPDSNERYDQLQEKVVQLAEKDVQLAEKDVQLAEKDAQLAEKDAGITAMLATLAKFRFGDSAAGELRTIMQGTAMPAPEERLVQDWLEAPSAEAFLDRARRYYARPQ